MKSFVIFRRGNAEGEVLLKNVPLRLTKQVSTNPLQIFPKTKNPLPTSLDSCLKSFEGVEGELFQKFPFASPSLSQSLLIPAGQLVFLERLFPIPDDLLALETVAELHDNGQRVRFTETYTGDG